MPWLLLHGNHRPDYLGVGSWFFPGVIMEWQRIVTAPFDRDLELAVIDYDGVHALAFPCRRILGSWMNAETKKKIEVYPTHWREWQDPR